jgi:hypothetical protein
LFQKMHRLKGIMARELRALNVQLGATWENAAEPENGVIRELKKYGGN